MLTCIAGSKEIDTIGYNLSDIKKWSNRGILKCPVCKSKLIFKNGRIRIPHFAHENDSECDYGFWENETKEHMIGKQLFYKWFKNISKIKYIKLEAWIAETKQRPDIYFETEDGSRYAIEYQCSIISIDKLEERRKLYKLAGINDIWLFGGEYNAFSKLKATEEWLLDKDGFIYYFDSLKNQLIQKEKIKNELIINKEKYLRNIEVSIILDKNRFSFNKCNFHFDSTIYLGNLLEIKDLKFYSDVIQLVRNKNITIYNELYGYRHIVSYLKDKDIEIIDALFDQNIISIFKKLISVVNDNVIILTNGWLKNADIYRIMKLLKFNNIELVDRQWYDDFIDKNGIRNSEVDNEETKINLLNNWLDRFNK